MELRFPCCRLDGTKHVTTQRRNARAMLYLFLCQVDWFYYFIVIKNIGNALFN